METTKMGYIGIIGYILGLYCENGKENGNYYPGQYSNNGCVISVMPSACSRIWQNAPWASRVLRGF